MRKLPIPTFDSLRVAIFMVEVRGPSVRNHISATSVWIHRRMVVMVLQIRWDLGMTGWPKHVETKVPHSISY